MSTPTLQQALAELQSIAAERDTKTPGWPAGFETKTLSGPGLFVLGSSMDAGRSIKAREAGAVEYISPDRWRRITTAALIRKVEASLDG